MTTYILVRHERERHVSEIIRAAGTAGTAGAAVAGT